jgi:hypothetical protein
MKLEVEEISELYLAKFQAGNPVGADEVLNLLEQLLW